jgi:hypothetical protein
MFVGLPYTPTIYSTCTLSVLLILKAFVYQDFSTAIILAAIIAIMVLIIERMVNRLYIYSTQEMNLIGPLYDTLFLKEKCHSKWHSNSNDTHVYILQKIHTGIRTM